MWPAEGGTRPPLAALLPVVLLMGVLLMLATTLLPTPDLMSYKGNVSHRSVADKGPGDPFGRQPFKKRLVHLDLKGAPPRLSFVLRFFKLLASLKVDGLLIEWEDMFPFEGGLAVIRAKNAYTKDDVRAMIDMAANLSLEVIPLIQTFGHMEYVLKHGKYEGLRENPLQESSICPSKNASTLLIREMIGQIRDAHTNSSRLHIGADEAFYVGEDEDCLRRLSTSLADSLERLKLDHIARVARLGLEAGFTEVLAWNDMFDKATVAEITAAKLGSLITPVVWGYKPDVTVPGYFPDGLFDRLSQTFPRLWLASAYKGANGAENAFLSIDQYLANHQSYVNLYRQFHEELASRTEGLILTGWSRFAHHSPLCELLPVAVPSLVVNLAYLENVKREPKQLTARAKDLLACPITPPRGLYEPRRLFSATFYPSREQIFTTCAFPGSDIFAAVQDLRFLHWKSHRVGENEDAAKQVNEELRKMERRLRPLLSAALFDDAVNEFLEANVRRRLVTVSES